MSRRLGGLLVSAGALLAWLSLAGVSHACGVWSVRDRGQGWLVVFRSISIDVVHRPDEKGRRKIVAISTTGKPSRQDDWRLVRLDPRRRDWLLGNKNAFSHRGATLYLDGKPVGSWSKTQIRIRKRSFELAFGKSYKPEASPYSMIPDNDGRSVTVSRGGSVVLEGAAPTERHCRDATRLIAIYLAWRELFMGKLASQ